MKTLILLILVISSAGCATLASVQGNEAVAASPVPLSAVAEPATPINQNIGPQIIIPATGGAPVIGIPLGGNIFQPVTGGAPIIGIPTSP